MQRGCLLGIGLLAATMVVVGLAQAAPDAERLRTAAEEFDAGRRAYKGRDFEGAASHFENADRDAPSPDALLAAIRSRKEAQQLSRAATLSQAGLARYPGDKALGDVARQVITDAEKSLYKVAVTCSPACTLVVDSRLMPFPESTRATFFLDPGPHTVVAGWANDRHATREVSATPGGAARLSLAAPAERVAAAVPAPAGPVAERAFESDEREEKQTPAVEKSGLPPVVFYVGTGATLVLTGVSVWSAVDTQTNPGVDVVREKCAPNDTNCPEYQQGLAHQRRTNILIGATAVVAVATGIIGLFLTKWGDSSRAAKETQASITPVVELSHGVVLGAVGRF